MFIEEDELINSKMVAMESKKDSILNEYWILQRMDGRKVLNPNYNLITQRGWSFPMKTEFCCGILGL